MTTEDIIKSAMAMFTTFSFILNRIKLADNDEMERRRLLNHYFSRDGVDVLLKNVDKNIRDLVGEYLSNLT